MSKHTQWLVDYLNQQLEETEGELVKFIKSVKPIPNPKYMVEENQRETIWSDEDNDTYYKLEFRRRFLQNEISKLNK